MKNAFLRTLIIIIIIIIIIVIVVVVVINKGIQDSFGFWIPSTVFRIPKPKIPDYTSKIFSDSGFHRQNFTDSGI